MRKFLSITIACATMLALCSTAGWGAKIAGYTTKSDNAAGYTVKLGPGKNAKTTIVVLDESKGTDTGFDTVMVDSNCDGSLADEEPTKKIASTSSITIFSVSVTAPFKKVDPEAKYTLSLYGMPKAGAVRQPIVLSTAARATRVLSAAVKKVTNAAVTTRRIVVSGAAKDAPVAISAKAAPALTAIAPRPVAMTTVVQRPRVMFSGATIGIKKGKQTWSYSISSLKPQTTKRKNGLQRVTLATKIGMDLKASIKDGKFSASSSIKDTAGQLLRGIRQTAVTDDAKPTWKTIGPHLKVIGPDGKAIVDKDLSFG